MSTCPDKIRLAREDWLRRALDILAESPTHLRIDHLAEKLGVSKGSFYFHFKDRADFIRALAEYWRDVRTENVARAVRDSEGTPEDRLRLLMESLIDQGPNTFEIPVRGLARIEPGIMDIIREVDEMRLNTLRSLFEEMGFEGLELEMRTRVFVACHSFDASLGVGLSREEALAQVPLRLAFFTRR